MLKFQIALITILIACVAFVSCDRAQQVLQPAADDMMPVDDMMAGDDMMMDMMKMMDSTMYMSWAHVMLPAPTMSVEEAAAAHNPAGTGAAHNPGSDVFTARTVYINDIGAMANKAGTAYPAGTMIFKEIMDETSTFVDKLAMMMKSDDPMYADHNGWVYKKYARPSADAEYMQVRGSNLEDAGNGCHGCHAKADNDSVFVSLPMEDIEGVDGAEGAGDMEDAGDMEGMDGADIMADMEGVEDMDGAEGAGDMEGMDGADMMADMENIEGMDGAEGAGDMEDAGDMEGMEDTGEADAGDIEGAGEADAGTAQ